MPASDHGDEPRPGRRERLRLCDLLAELGPHAPTLCEGWDTHDLAAHLVVRDSATLAGPGLVIPRLHGITERSERRARRRSYDDLLRALRGGPPVLAPLGLPVIRELTGIHEFFVHHEDVRRPAGLPPRQLEPDLDAAVWSRVRVLGPYLTRALHGSAVEVTTPDGRRARLQRGARGSVRLHGTPGELLLFLFNRRADAGVEVDGDAPGLRRLEAARLGV